MHLQENKSDFSYNCIHLVDYKVSYTYSKMWDNPTELVFLVKSRGLCDFYLSYNYYYQEDIDYST